MPFLSIIIPVYNAEKYLADCFDSIIRQKFTDFEVIVVDDESKDSSPAICDKYAESDDRFKVFHVKNGGPSKARNTAFSKATGEYVYCVDNDDYIVGDTYFEEIYKKLSKSPVNVLLTGASYRNDGSEKLVKHLSFENVPCDVQNSPYELIYWLIAHKNYETSCWTKVVNRKFLTENEFFFDENLTIEDLDWNMNFFRKLSSFAVLDVDNYMHVHRKGSVSNATGKKRYKSCLDQITVIDRWYNVYKDYTDSELLKKATLSYLSYQFFITVGKSKGLDKEYYKDIKKRLKKVDKIAKYSIEKKQKVISLIYRILGFNISVLLLGYYYGKRSDDI